MELIGGVERRDIVIVAYDEAGRGVSTRSAIGSVLRRAVTVDHIGSTSVPGLPAKAIIDIDLTVADVDDEPAYLPDLLAAGYELRVREPGHRMVRTPARDVHVHVTTEGSDWVRRDLLFRDRLRADAADRDAYAALKQQLAKRDWPDMNAYADAKTDLIQKILARQRNRDQAASSSGRIRGLRSGSIHPGGTNSGRPSVVRTCHSLWCISRWQTRHSITQFSTDVAPRLPRGARGGSRTGTAGAHSGRSRGRGRRRLGGCPPGSPW